MGGSLTLPIVALGASGSFWGHFYGRPTVNQVQRNAIWKEKRGVAP
jgi:hypothetical protein